MKPPAPKKNWKDRLRPAVAKVLPAIRVGERIAGVAVHLKTPTVLGVAGAAAAGASALWDLISQPERDGWVLELMFSRGYALEAFRSQGASIQTHVHNDGSERNDVLLHGVPMVLGVDGNLVMGAAPDEDFLEWLRQIFDRVLPPVMATYVRQGRVDTTYETGAGVLTHYRSEEGQKIWAQSKDLLAGGRAILLNGRPGVGKTTKAQEIAQLAELGRTVLLPNIILGPERDNRGNEQARVSQGGTRADTLRMLSAGVIIIDDVDKVEIRLALLEAVRAAAKLVILTANNGQHDEIIDGATIRAGRIDEVFEIAGSTVPRRPPFDRMNEEEWNEVRDWPIAYLNEIEKRLMHRSQDLRLEDLRVRVNKMTRSGGKLY
jgi:hypothetical protein